MPHNSKVRVSNASRALWVAYLLYFCAGFADGAMLPFFPLWATGQAHVVVGAIGLLPACYASGELIATPLLGGIADRLGRRPVLIASSSGVGLGLGALSLSHGFLGCALILLATGIFGSVLHPTISAVVADVTPADRRRRGFSLPRLWSGVGRVAGPAAGSLAALVSLRLVFVVGGAVLLIGAAVVSARLPETGSHAHGFGSSDDDDDEEGLGTLLPAVRDRRLASLLLWFLLLEVAGSWVESTLPLWARETGVLTVPGVGLLFTYAAIVGVLLQTPVARVTREMSGLRITLGVGAAYTFAFTILLYSGTLSGMIAAVSLFAIADALVGPLIPTAVSELASTSNRAGYLAAASIVSDLRDSIGPATGTAIYALSAGLPFAMGIPLAGVATIGLGRALFRHERASRKARSGLDPIDRSRACRK